MVTMTVVINNKKLISQAHKECYCQEEDYFPCLYMMPLQFTKPVTISGLPWGSYACHFLSVFLAVPHNCCLDRPQFIVPTFARHQLHDMWGVTPAGLGEEVTG